MHEEEVYRVQASSEMACSEYESRRRATGTSSWSKTWQLATLPYKQKTIYARSLRVCFTVASYWLNNGFTSMTRAAGTAPKYIQYWCTCT